MTKVYLVIHHITNEVALEQAKIASDNGADGVFLISHYGRDSLLPALAKEIKQLYPNMKVGINFLGNGILVAASQVEDYGLDMVWGDVCGVSSKGLTQEGEELSKWAKIKSNVEIFASVAFKYQPREFDPAQAAINAKQAGFIPTTSGSGTGSAPEVEKIKMMSEASEGLLGIASGMSIENVKDYTPYLSHILVATGVSVDDHHFDEEKVKQFINIVKN